MNELERELAELREKVARFERIEADRQNPNVLLLEGELNDYEGEFYALSVTNGAITVYLAEVVEKLLGWKDIATFQYHVSSEPKGFYELEEAHILECMGQVNTEFYHAYSDLTGYLWTTEGIKVGGHDVLKEIYELKRACEGTAYIALRVEKKGK